jgi:hypothetical protein
MVNYLVLSVHVFTTWSLNLGNETLHWMNSLVRGGLLLLSSWFSKTGVHYVASGLLFLPLWWKFRLGRGHLKNVLISCLYLLLCFVVYITGFSLVVCKTLWCAVSFSWMHISHVWFFVGARQLFFRKEAWGYYCYQTLFWIHFTVCACHFKLEREMCPAIVSEFSKIFCDLLAFHNLASETMTISN